jgi:Polyketide cyclase / dehydrase and lipid transport
MSASAPAPPPASGGRWSIQAQSRSSAPVEEVWPLIGEARRWKEWTFLTRSDLERTGDPPPDGVGAVRRFTRYGIGSREEVVAWEPPGHLAYTILAGFPVRNYRADVHLVPDGSGTIVTWAATFDEKIPATGRLMAAVLARMISRFASGAAAHASGLHDQAG